ncbi:MAG TPA: N-acetyltransferase [Rhizobiales bacterium]|nr:N-acetyltransferase [Hyphomicrobiales bacterium]
MIFQRAGSRYVDHGTEIETRQMILKVPAREHYAQWAALREESREFLEPWEPLWPPGDLERTSYVRRIKCYHANINADEAYPFFMFLRDGNDTLIGGITISNIQRGIAMSATLGYWIGAPFARQGYMSEAVRAVARFCFDRLGLHRVEAACIPENTASIGVLKNAGFRHEGLARAYLRINGHWRDHNLYGLLRHELRDD